LKTTRLLLCIGLCLTLTGLATPLLAEEEGDKAGGFEGWKEGDPPKPAEEPKPAEPPAPVEEPKPVEQPKPVEVGLGANAPGSHESFVPKVDLRYGSVQLMGVFQALMTSMVYINDDEDGLPDIDNTFMFRLQRARIMLKGHVASEKLEYFFQGDAVNTFSFALDAYLNYKIPMGSQLLQVRAGRFVPDFSFMMPRNTADLAAINYPLYLAGAPGAFATWRQTGIEIIYTPMANLNVMLGGFNGLQGDPFRLNPAANYMEIRDIAYTDPGTGATLNWSNALDNNKAKDFLLSVNYKIGDVAIALSNWFGMPLNLDDADENDFIYMGVLGGEWNNNKIHAVGEFAFRAIDYGVDNVDSVYSFALWGHFGYRVIDLLEVIARIDWYEPNLDNDADMLMRLTTGLHLWLEEKHFRVLFNLYWDIPVEEFDNRIVPMGILVQAAALW